MARVAVVVFAVVLVFGAILIAAMVPRLTIVVSAILGVTGFLAGQFVLRFVFQPALELRQTVGRIGHALMYYADLYSNPGTAKPELLDEARQELRGLASTIRTQHRAVVWYSIPHRLELVPSATHLQTVARHLTGLSNSLYHGDPLHNHKRRTEIERLLGLPSDEPGEDAAE